MTLTKIAENDSNSRRARIICSRKESVVVKRLFDIVSSAIALLFLSPVILIAAIGVKLSSRGPAFYLSQRAGRGNQPFTLYKLRTMHVREESGSAITSTSDPRVFAFGNLLRKTKIDELPQLLNILQGDMSVVGPRPEDPSNVERFYDDLGMSTLDARPGLSGIGSIYYYTHGEKLLVGDNTEEVYAKDLLPIKLALEAVYLKRPTLIYDLKLIFRTMIAIAQIAAGKTEFDEPREID